MSTITTKDGTRDLLQGLGHAASRSSSITAGRSAPTTGTTRCCSSSSKGYRVIAHDRRGHGRSTQTRHGNEMDTYAADVAELAAALDLKDAIHVGHSTGGGEVARYVARHGTGRVAKAVLIGAVPPIMVKSDKNPGGLPIEVFDGFRAGARRQPRAVLPRCADRPVLRLQPPGREGVAGRRSTTGGARA